MLNSTFFMNHGLRSKPKLNKTVYSTMSTIKICHFISRLTFGSFAQAYRILKPGRWITVEFHNSQNIVWMAI